MTEHAAMETLAKRFFDALEAADVATLKELYADGAELWRNTMRIVTFEGGFVHRHRLTGTRSDGAQVAAEICTLVFVQGGKIVRVEDYLDARQLEALSA